MSGRRVRRPNDDIDVERSSIDAVILAEVGGVRPCLDCTPTDPEGGPYRVIHIDPHPLDDAQWAVEGPGNEGDQATVFVSENQARAAARIGNDGHAAGQSSTEGRINEAAERVARRGFSVTLNGSMPDSKFEIGVDGFPQDSFYSDDFATAIETAATLSHQNNQEGSPT